MKGLDNFLKYLQDKKFVKKFEANKRNYENGMLLATTEYLDANIDMITYHN
jgi:hypothetical protein